MSAAADPAPPDAAAALAPAVLRAEHVTKEFGGLVAVEDVSLDLPRHSIVSLIGPNGAGKTTLFNMLTGLYRPTQGRILLGARDITRSRPDVITGYGVARTFQNIRLFGAMTAVENVMIGHHARMRAGLFGSIFRPSWVRREERETRERARDLPSSSGRCALPSTRRTDTVGVSLATAASPGPRSIFKSLPVISAIADLNSGTQTSIGIRLWKP